MAGRDYRDDRQKELHTSLDESASLRARLAEAERDNAAWTGLQTEPHKTFAGRTAERDAAIAKLAEVRQWADCNIAARQLAETERDAALARVTAANIERDEVAAFARRETARAEAAERELTRIRALPAKQRTRKPAECLHAAQCYCLTDATRKMRGDL